MGREKTWAVTVTVDGEEVLTIEHNFLSGIPNIDDHADEVRTCAAHLLAFIGPGPEPDETVAVYEFMQAHGDGDRNHWSYYDELLKSRKIKRAREEVAGFDAPCAPDDAARDGK